MKEFAKNNDLTSIEAKFAGTEKSKFGKIDGSFLVYKDNFYKINYVGKGVLILDTDKLFGRDGDEFYLDYVR